MNLKEIFITNKTNFRIAGALLVVVAVIAGIAFTKSYAVTTVNGRAIPAKQFFANYRMSVVYTENMRKALAGQGVTSTPTFSSENELKALVLTELVERSLVKEALAREVGSDLDVLVTQKIGKYENDSALKNVAQALYGITFETYKEEILIPQAEHDILSGRLFLKGQKYEEWLSETKQSAKVEVFSDDFEWNGTGVVNVK
jgi:hypothetical protein